MRERSARVLGLVLAVVVALPAMVLVQQDDKSRLTSTRSPDEFWNQHWSSGTRTDLAPAYNSPHDLKVVQGPLDPTPPGVNVIRAYTAEDARKACEAQVSGREVQTALLVQQMQNSKAQIPIVQPILNSMALEAAREQAKKDCEHAGEPIETRTVWGSGK